MSQHYADLSSRPFFGGLVKYMASGPVCPMVWEGLGVVKTGRVMLGETNPKDSAPGTIRGDYCIQVLQLLSIIASEGYIYSEDPITWVIRYSNGAFRSNFSFN